jgi:hypothetical protein
MGPRTAEDVALIPRRAHSRTEPARLVARARLSWLAYHGQRWGVPRAGGGLETPRSRAERCGDGSPACPSGHRGPLGLAGAPPLGVRLPAEVCALSAAAGAGVAGVAVVGPEGTALRDMGPGLAGGGGSNPVGARPSSSLHLGPAAPPSTPSPPWPGAAAKRCMNLADAPLRVRTLIANRAFVKCLPVPFWTFGVSGGRGP